MNGFSVDLSGKTAIVTGAGAGVGRTIAITLAQSGANVTINDINPDRVERVAGEIQQAGGSAIAIQADISNRFQASAVIEQTRDAFGAVHILVNAAGAYKIGELAKIDEWDWRRQVEVNLTGTFFMIQLLSRVMVDEKITGSIVNLGHSAQHNTLETGAGYIASKAGVIGLTHQTARELGPSGIRVNAVCPGKIEGDDMPTDQPNMLGKIGSLEDVAAGVLFLCSPAAQFITGQALYIDGGRL